MLYKPSQVFGVEISETYRKKLKLKFENQNVSIFSNDAKDLTDVLADATVDKILAVNVVYFLEPLDLYIKEFHRIMKKGSKGIIACKFNGIASFDDSVAVNKDIEFVISSFAKRGFEINPTDVDLGKDFSKYTAISITKR